MDKKYFLKPRDTIGISAPSARFDLKKFNAGVQILQNLGYKVCIPEEIFGKKRYLAGDDMLRATVINQLFSDPGIDGIMCARGGFGSMRLLEHLNWELIKNNPKLFIGFSDITAILLPVLEKTDHIVIHGPTLVSFADAKQQTLDSFQRIIQGFFDTIEIPNGDIIRPGRCRGVLKGGNISTISHLLGTKFQPDFNYAVLFLEDIGEPAYKIDRMLTQMKMAGMFKHVAGVITGSFKECDNDHYIHEILFEIFQQYHIPIITNMKAGHGNINLSLPMGMDIEMDIKMDIKTSKINWI
jgi:muramoyltetrapeptide carboxypeptidase